MEFYFSVAVARTPGAPPTRMRGKHARQPTGSVGLSPIWRERQRRLRNGVTERQYGHSFYGNGYGNGYGER